jgi:hypothetical protein
MTIIRRLERKQLIVILGSVLLASSSYFIPLPERTTSSPPPPEQVQKPSLPLQKAEQQPAADPVPSQLAHSQTTSKSTAEGPPTSTDLSPPSESAAVNQPPVTRRQALAIPSTKEPPVSPVIEPLSDRDFYAGSPHREKIQPLPITQDGQF